MRLVILGISLALAGSAPLALAVAQPVSTQPLAPGEVLLELSAIGTVTWRADTATLNVMVYGTGATPTEALAAAEALTRRVTDLARANGVAAPDMTVRPVRNNMSIEMMASNTMMMAEDVSPSASASIEIRVRNIARLDALAAALSSIERATVSNPVYALSDTAPARREARARALATLRADAEAYAAAANMRVVRIVRITERAGMDFMGLALGNSDLMRRTLGGGSGSDSDDPDVGTFVIVGADFALAPR
ncbi:MAG: uncharacterized protein QOD42_2596 [Sphingomonadales bacterium]|jgi:uncharacterized protein YggE|nr:uncharacterized protein [Sphingomonadales bacterium]